MTIVKTMKMALMLAIASWLPFSTNVQACSCVAGITFKESACSADVAFVGRVVAKFDNCPGGACDPILDQGDGQITFIVSVLRTFSSGAIEDQTVFLTTAVNSALCGTSFKFNVPYLFLLNEQQFFGVIPPPPSIALPMSLPVSSCSPVFRWNSVKFPQRALLRNLQHRCQSFETVSAPSIETE